MQIKVGVYSTLRHYLDPRPPIGEYILMDYPVGTPVGQIVEKLGLPLTEIAIILIKGKHQTLDYRLQESDEKIALFPLSGGG